MTGAGGTRKRSAEQGLADDDLPALFAQIFATAADAMLVVDAAGKIVLANAQCASMFGHAIETLQQLSVEDLVPERIRKAHKQHRKSYAGHAMPRPMGINTTLRALRSDGAEFPVEISLSPLVSGEKRLFCANIRNVSELRRAQQSVERADRAEAVAEFGRLAIAAQSTPDAVRAASELIRAHLECEDVLVARKGNPNSEVILEPGCTTTTPSINILLPLIFDRLSDLAAKTGETVLLIEDLEPLPKALSSAMRAAHLRSALVCAIPGGGEPVGFLAALGRKGSTFTQEDSSFLGALANTLGSLRQRHLAEEQLFQSQRLEALGQLTGGVAHDFNNLLTVVSGNLQILEERSARDPVALAMVKSALRASGRGADLTRKLLAFARRQTLQPRAIDVASWLDSLAEILRRTLGPNIDIRTQCDKGLPPIKADPAMLDTALLNLAVNARDAMPNGGILALEATLMEHREDADPTLRDLPTGWYVMLSVRDTGSGMPPEVLARAFEPFFTTKDSGKGSGLGLSLVYGFAKQSGGHIAVDSRPHQGTVVNILLPTLRGLEAAHAPAVMDAADGGNERILVLEDDDDVREIAVGLLVRLGYGVTAASEAKEALELIQLQGPFDLLFTDVVLRGPTNGADVARLALEAQPSLGVLFTSGYAPHVLKLDEALSRGVELLGKPYRIEQLARMVRRALDARDQAATSSRRTSLRPNTPRKRSRS
jgi:PAS domain S-box-containing protein